MNLRDLISEHGSLAGHRLVIEAADGTFLEVDSVRLLKLMPDIRFVQTGSDGAQTPEAGDWSGPLEIPDDPEKTPFGERVIVLSARPA